MRIKTDLTLRPDASVRAGFLRLVDKLAQRVVDRNLTPGCDPSEDVHSVRTTIKRLRTILRLIRPGITKTVFERENLRLKEVAHRLSLARDRQVPGIRYRRWLFSSKREHEAVAAALAGLEADPHSESSIDETMRRAAADLEQTRRSLHRLRFAGSEWNVIALGLREVYRQGRKRMKTALADGSDTDFHKWRIRLKNLYYELQLLEPIWGKRLSKTLSHLAKLQEKIGDDHDLVVLKSLLRKDPAAFGGTDAVERIICSVDDKSRRLRRSIGPLGEAIFALSPERFVRKLGQHWKVWRNGGAGRNAYSKLRHFEVAKAGANNGTECPRDLR